MDRHHDEERHARRRAATLLELALDLAGLVDLEHVALADVLEVLEHDAALEALLDLAHVVLEAPQRADPAVVDDGPSRTSRTCAPRVILPWVT